MLKDEIKDILFSDYGVYERFRNGGDFGCLTDDIQAKLIEFADEVEESIRSGTPDVEGMQILVGVLDLIHSMEFAKNNEKYLEKYKKDYNGLYIEISGRIMIG